MSQYNTLPAAGSFDILRLDDAYLIVSLNNLVWVSKRFPMSVRLRLSSITRARERERERGTEREVEREREVQRER